MVISSRIKVVSPLYINQNLILFKSYPHKIAEKNVYGHSVLLIKD